jgi:uncharacterized protein (TIGR02594 family)
LSGQTGQCSFAHHGRNTRDGHGDDCCPNSHRKSSCDACHANAELPSQDQQEQGPKARSHGNSRDQRHDIAPAGQVTWGRRTARAVKDLLAAHGRPAAIAPLGPLRWITEARSALGRHEVRDRSWWINWLKRDGRSLGDPSKNPWCGDFVETCIRVTLPDELLLGALGANPYWARNWLLLGMETQPILSAALVFARGPGGHVGFAVGQDGTHFHVLGGNQFDAVTVARVAKSRLLGARWPRTYPLRPEPLPSMAPGETLTTTNEF